MRRTAGIARFGAFFGRVAPPGMVALLKMIIRNTRDKSPRLNLKVPNLAFSAAQHYPGVQNKTPQGLPVPRVVGTSFFFFS